MARATQSKEDVFRRIQENRERLRLYGVRTIGLFGSFVRDEQSADSDLDLLIEFEAGQKSFDNFMRLAFFLEELLGRRVELVTPEALSPYLGPRILAETEYVALSA